MRLKPGAVSIDQEMRLKIRLVEDQVWGVRFQVLRYDSYGKEHVDGQERRREVVLGYELCFGQWPHTRIYK